MDNNIKIFEMRKKILNKIIPEIKEDIIQFLLKNTYNTIDFNYMNNSAREEYIIKKIKNTKKIISVNDLTKEKLKELFFSKGYNENFFNEIISEEVFRWKFSAKANKESDFDNYYKNRYHNLMDFLDNVYEVKRLENKSYYESFQKFIGEKTNVKLFLGGIETKDVIFTEKKNKEYDMLKNNLINVLKNPYCTFQKNEMSDEKILEIEKAEKTGFFLETLDFADYENGAILVDLFVNLQTNEKYCKWAFLNWETEEISENFIELEKLKEIWKLNEKEFKKITNIVKDINKDDLLVNAGNGDVKNFKIEYDKEHISEIFKYPY